MNKKDGGPAFPIPPIDNGPGNIKSQPHYGMSLRDWFAGMALQGILAGRYWEVAEITDPITESYNMANEMIEVSEDESD